MPIKTIREFIKFEASGGIILFAAAVLALIFDNSPLRHYYEGFFDLPLGFHMGPLHLAKPLVLWINEGLMAIFFLLVGLEIKREIFEGELNSLSKVSLPAIAAIGGMAAPALVYVLFNHANAAAMHGWAIPTATDIAFALGILTLLGPRVPLTMKVFLTALAIFDDIGAIVIIAIFYTAKISLLSLGFASICLLLLFILNRAGVKRYTPYIIVGVLLWLAVMQSGVHATLAGVALAFAIPLKGNGSKVSPLRKLEHGLHPWVAFGVLPIFAFANAGISFAGLHWQHLFTAIPLGIILGLFIGKQIGVFGATLLSIKCGLCKKPRGSSWLGIYGISLIAGVGFTMSLFIGMLAFDEVGTSYAPLVRFGVLSGSLLSGALGYLLLRFTSPLKDNK